MIPLRRQKVAQIQLHIELQLYRELAGMLQRDVAEALGCAQSKISKIESARLNPSVRETMQLVDLYGVPEAKRRVLIDASRVLKRGGHRTDPYVGMYLEMQQMRQEMTYLRTLLEKLVPDGAPREAHALDDSMMS